MWRNYPKRNGTVSYTHLRQVAPIHFFQPDFVAGERVTHQYAVVAGNDDDALEELHERGGGVVTALAGGTQIPVSYTHLDVYKRQVLDNGKSLMLALSQDMAQNRPVEAKSHVDVYKRQSLSFAAACSPSSWC